jgi:hypothetical protein
MVASWRVLGKVQSVVRKALQLGQYALNLGITPCSRALPNAKYVQNLTPTLEALKASYTLVGNPWLRHSSHPQRFVLSCLDL